jgi:hypothetical protein
VASEDTRCAACSAVLVGAGAPALVGAPPALDGTDVTTHLTPDTGIQAYPQPYPPYPGELGPFLSGRRAVQVVAVRGVWAHVFADGADQGWVEGGRLLPPIGAAIPHAPTPGAAGGSVAPGRQSAFSPGQVIGAVSALGMIVGALVTWTQIVSLNAFKFPVQFLFDNKTQSHDPRLGWFIIVLGVLGLAASIVRGAELFRTIIGILGVIIAVLFLLQVANGLTAAVGPFRPQVGFTDIVGGGPWITGIAALMLGVSPLFN